MYYKKIFNQMTESEIITVIPGNENYTLYAGGSLAGNAFLNHIRFQSLHGREPKLLLGKYHWSPMNGNWN